MQTQTQTQVPTETMTNINPLKPLETYFNLMTYNGAAYVFQVAAGFGILRSFADGPKTAAQVAEACGLRREPCALLLQCLAGMDLLQESDGLFVPAPVMRFLSGTYSNLGKEYWDHLPTFLKTATPIARMDNPVDSEREYQRQVTSLDWMMKPSAMAVAKMLGIGQTRKGLSILDLGAGSGVWSLEFLKHDPTATATLVDWPGVLEIAKNSVQANGLTSRVECLAGSYHELAFPEEKFDSVILGNVTHIENPEGLSALLAKCEKTLKPGGEVLIFDVFTAQEQGRLPAALYAMGLALRTEQGRVYSFEALKHELQTQGFTEIEFQAIPVAPFTMGLVRARKF